MVKKRFGAIVFAAFFFVLLTVPVQAGTLIFGGKAWFAMWNSELGETLGKTANQDLELFLNDFYFPDVYEVKVTKTENGLGFLGGPIISYQTEDKAWTVSLAFMWISSFSQNVESQIDEYSPGLTTAKFDYDLELTRKEIDIAIARALDANWKVFGGYKRQSLDSKFKANIPDEGSFDVYEVNIDIDVLTAGVGYSTPLSDVLALGFQVGLLYIMPDLDYKDYLWDESGTIDMKDTLGVNAELSLTYLASESIAIQAGYRYQYMKFDFDDPDVDMDPINDSFHGITITAVYMLPVGS